MPRPRSSNSVTLASQPTTQAVGRGGRLMPVGKVEGGGWWFFFAGEDNKGVCLFHFEMARVSGGFCWIGVCVWTAGRLLGIGV